MTGAIRRACLTRGVAIVAGLIVLQPLGGQPVAALSAAVEVSSTRVDRAATSNRLLGGPLLSAQGRIGFGRFEVEGRYAEGSLTPLDGTGGLSEDLVEGAAALWFRPRSWVAIGAGPRLRAFITPSGTAHWTRMEARARVDGDLIVGLASAFLEGWVAASATTNVQGGGDSALGGEAGLTVRMSRLPLAVRLGYSADRARFVNGGAEFIEAVRVSLLIGPF